MLQDYFMVMLSLLTRNLGGVDIFGEGFAGYFPITKVNYTKVGLNLYTPIYKVWGSTLVMQVET
jgi:hypothetical protein